MMNNKSFYVFSYGSNLLLERIKARIDSVEVVTTHKFEGYRIVFNKKSVDGSTKANLKYTGNADDFVLGVIHRIDANDKAALDLYEGLGFGYESREFKVQLNGEAKGIHFYIATDDQHLRDGRPYSWYHDFVVAGAKQNGFPVAYISALEEVETVKDGNGEREEINQKILMGEPVLN